MNQGKEEEETQDGRGKRRARKGRRGTHEDRQMKVEMREKIGTALTATGGRERLQAEM